MPPLGLIQNINFRGPSGGGGGFVGPLDDQTTGLTFAMSLKRRLLSVATDPLFKVRSSASGSPTLDIGATAAGVVDSSALATFAGSDSLYVTEVYPQANMTGNLTQATASSQPRLYNAGTIEDEGGMYFDGGDDCMTTPTFPVLDFLSASSGQLWFRVKAFDPPNNGRLFTLTGNDIGLWYPFSGALYFDYASPFTGRISVATPTGVVGEWADVSLEKEGGTSRIRINGTVVVSGSTSAVLSAALVALFLGCAPDGSSPFRGWIKEMAVWNDGTAANCIARCAALAA